MECWEYKKRAVRWHGGYCEYFLPTESPRDSKRQLRTVTWPIHRWKYRLNYQGIQNGNSIQWRAMFTVRRADEITDEIGSLVKPLKKVNILSTLSSLISPSSSLSQLSPTANNQPQKKKSPCSQHNKSYFLKSSRHSIRILIYRLIFISFCK
jgi:hypothetical protein